MAQRVKWVVTLAKMMETQGLTPRSLSLQAGLNETAVRDMLAGRAKFPRYDTIKAIADVLGTTPATLMGDTPAKPSKTNDSAKLDLLTEIITRATEASQQGKTRTKPAQFAKAVLTIYRTLATKDSKQLTKKQVEQQIASTFKVKKA